MTSQQQQPPAAAGAGASSSSAIVMPESEHVLEGVRDYYGKVLAKTSDLKTSACTTGCAIPPKFIRQALKKVPKTIIDKFYGCGNPVPSDSGLEGLQILDLGSGSGRDVYVLSLFAGATGKVTGVDMTEEQLAVARAHVDEFRTANPTAAPMDFVHGFIEDLAQLIPPASVDLVVSNCVVNLSPSKIDVLKGVFHSLKNGGEFYFSDVYSSRRLPDAARTHDVLVGECIGGALYINDFIALAKECGFTDPREVSRSPIEINDAGLRAIVGPAEFFSITYRLFKIASLEASGCEDYGQIAVMTHPVDSSSPFFYSLDANHTFELNRPKLVCGNTADMLKESWLSRFFQILGDKGTHFGAFDCSAGGGCGAGCAGGGADTDGGDCCSTGGAAGGGAATSSSCCG